MERLGTEACEPAPQPAPQAFQDSSVKRYVCERWAGDAACASASWADLLEQRWGTFQRRVVTWRVSYAKEIRKGTLLMRISEP